MKDEFLEYHLTSAPSRETSPECGPHLAQQHDSATRPEGRMKAGEGSVGSLVPPSPGLGEGRKEGTCHLPPGAGESAVGMSLGPRPGPGAAAAE